MFGCSRWKNVTVGDYSYSFDVALRALIVISDIKGSRSVDAADGYGEGRDDGARASAQL